MNKLLAIFFVLTVSSLFAQNDELANSITRGNWQFDYIKDRHFRVNQPKIGDTILLSKSPKRLKYKKNRPFRFNTDGVVLMPMLPRLGCGNLSTFESIWYLKWRKYSTWKVIYGENKTIMKIDNLTLKLIESSKKKYTFKLIDVDLSSSNN